MNFIDTYLNGVTMYRLVLYYLSAVVGVAFVAGFWGLVPYDPALIAFSTVVALGTTVITNKVFASVFAVTANVESAYITALILVLIVSPVAPTNIAGVGFMIFMSVWSIASKYLIAVNRKHLFNPAAFGVALGALALGMSATWWAAGNAVLLPVLIVGGLMVVRKMRRFDLFFSFLSVSLITVALTATVDVTSSLQHAVLNSSMLFLGFIMLTEPLTMPPSRWGRVAYAALVGVLIVPAVHFGTLYPTPELALLVGNLLSYSLSPKRRYMLTLKRIEQAAEGVLDYVFIPDAPIAFVAGQYLEWTLGTRSADNRGNRRFFTIASAPSTPEVRLGVKFYPEPSSFKQSLAALKLGDTVEASQLAGEFVLPHNKKQKVAFIAGGIGVTPFRSMLEELLITKEQRPVVMLYGTRTAADVAYKAVFDRAQRELGIQTHYVLSNQTTPVLGMQSGTITGELVAHLVPDFKERLFYISGPQGMVVSFKKSLRALGVPRSHIHTDYFPGFV